jgi:hypothetical protein
MGNIDTACVVMFVLVIFVKLALTLFEGVQKTSDRLI